MSAWKCLSFYDRIAITIPIIITVTIMHPIKLHHDFLTTIITHMYKKQIRYSLKHISYYSLQKY